MIRNNGFICAFFHLFLFSKSFILSGLEDFFNFSGICVTYSRSVLAKHPTRWILQDFSHSGTILYLEVASGAVVDYFSKKNEDDCNDFFPDYFPTLP